MPHPSHLLPPFRHLSFILRRSHISPFRHSSLVIRHSLAFLALALPTTLRADPPSPPPLPSLTLDVTSPPISIPPAAKTQLDSLGLTIAGLLQLDISKNLRGGLDTQSIPIRYLFDLNFTLDANKLLHLPNATLFLDFQSHDGPNASDSLIGDYQGFDNLDAPHFLAIAQLWYQQTLLQNQLRLKLGKIDANADFDVIDHGNEFLNSAFSYNTTMILMPTYPDNAPGLELFLNSTPSSPASSPITSSPPATSPSATPSNFTLPLYAGVGVFYANRDDAFLTFIGHPQNLEISPGGLFLISELGSRFQNPLLNNNDTHAALGAWTHTGSFPLLNSETSNTQSGTGGTEANMEEGHRHNGASGLYALFDQTLFADPSTSPAPRNVGLFLNYGLTQPSLIPIAQQLATGLSSKGFLTLLKSDTIGTGISWAQPGDQPTTHPFEFATELFYRLQLTPWASIKTDAQYINHPSSAHPDALVLTTRLELDF